MIHGAQKIIVAVPLTQILPRPPGFTHFPTIRPEASFSSARISRLESWKSGKPSIA